MNSDRNPLVLNMPKYVLGESYIDCIITSQQVSVNKQANTGIDN